MRKLQFVGASRQILPAKEQIRRIYTEHKDRYGFRSV